jgi:hypothetical protein
MPQAVPSATRSMTCGCVRKAREQVAARDTVSALDTQPSYHILIAVTILAGMTRISYNMTTLHTNTTTRNAAAQYCANSLIAHTMHEHTVAAKCN